MHEWSVWAKWEKTTNWFSPSNNSYHIEQDYLMSTASMRPLKWLHVRTRWFSFILTPSHPQWWPSTIVSYLRFPKMSPGICFPWQLSYNCAISRATHPHWGRKVVRGSNRNKLPTRNYEYIKNLWSNKTPFYY